MKMLNPVRRIPGRLASSGWISEVVSKQKASLSQAR
jgi:hypothetical protein